MDPTHKAVTDGILWGMNRSNKQHFLLSKTHPREKMDITPPTEDASVVTSGRRQREPIDNAQSPNTKGNESGSPGCKITAYAKGLKNAPGT